ncbi:MAG: Gldg family protein [Myxococcales bacterium]|nr:Gldg family protein [Myxococcales bacterium]
MLRFARALLACTVVASLPGCGDGQKPPATTSSIAVSATPETTNKPEPLTRASRRLVCEGLKQELRIDAYVTRGTPALDAFSQKVATMLGHYEAATFESSGKTSASKVKAQVIDPKTDELRARAREAGVQEQAFGEGDEQKVTLTQGFSGFVLTYGAEREVIPFWPPENGASFEFFLTTKMRELRDRADGISTRFGVVTGKKELRLSEKNSLAPDPGPGISIEGVLHEYFPSYKLEEVDLRRESPIDAGLRGLIITQPGEAYTVEELRRIDEFVLLGERSLVVYVSAVNLPRATPAMEAKLDLFGVDGLLGGYGIEMKKDMVLDFARGARLPVLAPDGSPTPLTYRAVPILGEPSRDGSQLDAAFAPFLNLHAVPFPFASTLLLHPEKQPGAKLRAVARTSSQSTSITAEALPVHPSTTWKQEGPAEPRVVAATVEGELRSAFASGPEAQRSKAPSRVLVVSSSQFLANPFARAGNGPELPPQLQMMGTHPGDPLLLAVAKPYATEHLRTILISFKSTLDWMNADAEWAELGATLAAPAP